MSEVLEAKELLEKLKTEKLHKLTDGYDGGIYNGPQFVRNYVDDPKYGVPFLTTSTMLQADFSHIPTISAKDAHSTKLSYLEIKEGMTLITCSGTIGGITYARKNMVGIWSNQDIMKVVPDTEKIKPGYLYAFLSSRFGIPLIVSGTYGAIIQHIEPEHIIDLPVPRLGKIEDKVHELVQQAADLRVEAAISINKATADFLVSAGLKNLTPLEWSRNSGQLGFSANIPKTTLRAINYVPLNQNIQKLIMKNNFKSKPLYKTTVQGTLRSGLRFKRIDSDPAFGVELIGQREISNIDPKGRWIAKNKLPQDKLLFVPSGTIMVNAQGGLDEGNSFARVQFISSRNTKYAYSQHFLRVIANEKIIPGGALFAYLRSDIAFRLFRGCAVGSMQQDFHPDLVANIPVPIISDEESKRIDKNVRNAYKKYDDAVDLEDQARSLVERAIESGGR
jgi:type I restriction enzyme S subunit